MGTTFDAIFKQSQSTIVTGELRGRSLSGSSLLLGRLPDLWTLLFQALHTAEDFESPRWASLSWCSLRSVGDEIASTDRPIIGANVSRYAPAASARYSFG